MKKINQKISFSKVDDLSFKDSEKDTIKTTNDNFSSNDIEVAQTFSSWGSHSGSNNYEAMHCNYVFDCENTSTHKFKMRYASTGTIIVAGNTDANETYVTVIRIGDT